MAVYYALALIPVCDRLIYAYLEANAWLSNLILHGLGQDTRLTDTTIRSARFAITVRRGCDAIEPAWLFCAAVLAYPGRAGPKVLFCLAGTLALQLLNLVRIVSLFFVGLHWPGFFQSAHLEIWPVVFIVIALLLWTGWIRWTRQPVRAATPADA
jgi:exosortase/archaeosortase family protein